MLAPIYPNDGLVDTSFLKAFTAEQLKALQSDLNQELYARYEEKLRPYDLDVEAEW